MRSPTAHVVLAALLALAMLPGCLMPPWEDRAWATDDDDAGDDDDTPGDWAWFDGMEHLNIDWTAEEEADGHFDCAASWSALGPATTDDDQSMCPACDLVWRVTLVAEPGVEECLDQGTGINNAPASYLRAFGARLDNDQEFAMFRSAFSLQAPLGAGWDAPLVQAGDGSFAGSGFTWSGREAPVVNDQLGYSFFFSGEGQF